MGSIIARGLGLACTLALVALTAGCVERPLGDFERPGPDFTHDVAMPTVGKARAWLAKEPVSNFNQTDQEKLMHDRIWRFLISPHSRDWAFDASVELKRTRISTAADTRFALDRYYKWLHRTDYASSRVRYGTVDDDIRDDLATLPDTFTAICAVIEVDRARRVALTRQGGMSAETSADVAARQAENGEAIGWFSRALGYRYHSYDYALKQLLVETPHEEARVVDARLNDMALYVQAAERGDFCGRFAGGDGKQAGGAIPSRYATMRPDSEVVEQK